MGINPLDPAYVAGFKAGAYSARRRLELNPTLAPLPQLGSVKCSQCGNDEISFLITKPTTNVLDRINELILQYEQENGREACRLIKQHVLELLK